MAEVQKKKSKPRKKEKKTLSARGVAHVKSTFNNTIVTITDPTGAVVAWASSGKMGYKGSRKGTPFAAQLAAESAAREVLSQGMRKVEVWVKGPGSGREAAIRSLQAAGLEVSGIKDVTLTPHNGCRPPRSGGACSGFQEVCRMARYTDAVCKLCRREGVKLFRTEVQRKTAIPDPSSSSLRPRASIPDPIIQMAKHIRSTRTTSLPKKLLAVLCCLLGALAGCAHEKEMVVSEADMPPPEALFERLTVDADPGKTLVGILHVVASLPGERYTFKIGEAVKRPDSLRLEDLSVIGLPDFMLTVKGSEIRMFLPRSGEFMVGTESSEPIRRIFPPAVKPLDLVALLYGQPPGIFSAKSVKGSVDGSRFRLDVYAQGTWAQSLWVDPVTGRLVKVEIADSHGNRAYRVLFHDAVEVGSLTVPGRIEIETEGTAKVRLSLRNADMELVSRDDGPDFFRLKSPEGMTPRVSNNSAGTGLVYSTYLGGLDNDWGQGIAIGLRQRLYYRLHAIE